MKKLIAVSMAALVVVMIHATCMAAVTDNTYDGMVDRLEVATNDTMRGGVWNQSLPTSRNIKIQGTSLLGLDNTDTNATVDATDTVALTAGEVLWTPNSTDSIMYISRDAGSNDWVRVPVATRLFEVISVNTNANVPATSAAAVTATAAYQVLLAPNATNGVAFYYSSAAGTNSWKTVAR